MKDESEKLEWKFDNVNKFDNEINFDIGQVHIRIIYDTENSVHEVFIYDNKKDGRGRFLNDDFVGRVEF